MKQPSKQELLDDFKRIAEELDKTPTSREYRAHGEYNPGDLQRIFGSYNEGVVAAGLEKNARGREPTADAELFAELGRLEERLGHTPTAREMRKHGGHGSKMYIDRFGSWSSAVEMAGMESNKQAPREISEEDLEKEMLRVNELVTHYPSEQNMDNLGKYDSDTYRRQYGSFRDALIQMQLLKPANSDR